MLTDMKQKYRQWFTITPDNALYDRALFWSFLLLLSIGIIAVSTASVMVEKDPFYYVKRELIYSGLAMAVFFTALCIPMAFWQKRHVYFFLGTLFLLLVVLVAGQSVNGSRRWIAFSGLTFQPSELAKLSLICYLSSYFVRHYQDVRSKKLSAVKPAIVMAIFGFCILAQPDLGSVIVLFVITIGMLFIVGANLGQFFVTLGIGVLSIIGFIFSEPYRLKRVTGFLDPFDDPFNKGYQLTNSLMAFGRGELSGEGLGNSLQKLQKFPEIHTDFVLAVWGEEFGLIGILFILFVLGLLVFRALKIGREALLAEQRFNGFFAFGISFWLIFQGFVNLGMALGMLPTKGLTFPLVSYGGSSMIVVSVAIGILMRIDHENRIGRSGHVQLRDD